MTIEAQTQPTPAEIKSEPNVKQAVPFFMVTNMDASLRYYIDGLGFELKNDERPKS